jgi:hypothetical protein
MLDCRRLKEHPAKHEALLADDRAALNHGDVAPAGLDEKSEGRR